MFIMVNPIAAPATQNETAVLHVLCLPCNGSRSPNDSIVARLPRTSAKEKLMMMMMMMILPISEIQAIHIWICKRSKFEGISDTPPFWLSGPQFHSIYTRLNLYI